MGKTELKRNRATKDNMKGVYLVFFSLDSRKEIEIGSLGNISFDPGLYIYTGSGRNSVEKRVERHSSSDVNSFWHIDYFSEEAEMIDYFILPEKSSYECFMARKLEEFGEPVDGFGSSDCSCNSHFFRVDPESF
ncbi:MAG: Uri superfamily endonuclease [Candidatus Nanohaloarchaea archaeon]